MGLVKEVLLLEGLDEKIVDESIFFYNFSLLRECLSDYFALRKLNGWAFIGIGFKDESDDYTAITTDSKIKLEDIHLNFEKNITHDELPSLVDKLNEFNFNIDISKISEEELTYDNGKAELYVNKNKDYTNFVLDVNSTAKFNQYFM